MQRQVHLKPLFSFHRPSTTFRLAATVGAPEILLVDDGRVVIFSMDAERAPFRMHERGFLCFAWIRGLSASDARSFVSVWVGMTDEEDKTRRGNGSPCGALFPMISFIVVFNPSPPFLDVHVFHMCPWLPLCLLVASRFEGVSKGIGPFLSWLLIADSLRRLTLSIMGILLQ